MALMTQRAFNLAAGTLFLIVTLLHALRLFFGWHAAIGGWIVPMWVSWVGVAVAGFLAYTAFGKKK
jgi:hypothetical protein